MSSEASFSENIIKSFQKIIKEIEKGSSEHDIRYRFVKYFVEEVLGYEPKYIKWEKKRADLTIIDENDFAVIKIETKKPTVNINKPEYEEQAFKYEEEATRFIGLTNFLQFKLWEIKQKGTKLIINIDFSSVVERKKSFRDLSSDEQSQILFLNNLTKQVLFDPGKYEKFNDTYARIDITHDVGFKKLLDRLNYIANTLLYGYTLKSFGEYKEGYGKYLEELHKAEHEMKNNGNNSELNHSFAKYKQKLEEKYAKYKTFSGYDLWKEYSGKENVPDDEVKEIFCKETIYVFLNKLLFLRICEDKGLLEKNISNGGIEELRTVLKKRFKEDILNKEILKIAFGSAKEFYSHFYETGILDWFRTGDGELNELLNRVLWIFNQFDFTHVDRDILGNLYEKYLPGKERKRLGEFYTPVEVIDYILTSVGYTYSYDIETGDKKWEYPILGRIKDGLLLDEDTIYTGSSDFTLYALDRHIGKLNWKFETGVPIHTRPILVKTGTGTPVEEQVLYFRTEKGVLHALKLVETLAQNDRGESVVLKQRELKWKFPQGKQLVAKIGQIETEKVIKTIRREAAAGRMEKEIDSFTGKIISFIENGFTEKPGGQTTNVLVGFEGAGTLFLIVPGVGGQLQILTVFDDMQPAPETESGEEQDFGPVALGLSAGAVYYFDTKPESDIVQITADVTALFPMPGLFGMADSRFILKIGVLSLHKISPDSVKSIWMVHNGFGIQLGGALDEAETVWLFFTPSLDVGYYYDIDEEEMVPAFLALNLGATLYFNF